MKISKSSFLECYKPKKISKKEYFENTKRNNIDFACQRCLGKGKIKDPSQYDVVEGYKLADYITCSECNGEKTLGKKYFEEEYQKYLLDFQRKQTKYLKLKNILNKLTNEEFVFLYYTR